MVTLPQKNVKSYCCAPHHPDSKDFLSEMHLTYQLSGLTENLGQFHESAGQIQSISEVASLKSVGTDSATVNVMEVLLL